MNVKSGNFRLRQVMLLLMSKTKSHGLLARHSGYRCLVTVATKTNLRFSDCDIRSCSFPLPWELSFIGNIQSETGKGSENFELSQMLKTHPAGSDNTAIRRVPFDKNSRKFRFKIDWNSTGSFRTLLFWKFQSTSRGCPFFRKFGNAVNFLFQLAFLSGMKQP